MPGIPAKAERACAAASSSCDPRNKSAMTMTSSRTRAIVPCMAQFTLEPPSQANLIRTYSASDLHIAAQRITGSCIVTASELISVWEPHCFAELMPAHLEAVVALSPELVLLATGTTQRFASLEVRA